MLPLPTKATTELMMRKQTLAQTDTSPRTVAIDNHKLFTNIWIPASRRIISNAHSEGMRKSGLFRGHKATDLLGYNLR